MNQEHLFILIAITLILMAAGYLLIRNVLSAKDTQGKTNKKSNPLEIKWPYRVKPLMSQPEQVLYYRLIDAFPSCLVFAQVSLSRILSIKKGRNPLPWFNRISQMSVDFVVCSKDAKVLIAIELDDSTHRRAERKRADETKDRAMRSADVLLIRYPVNAIPNAADLSDLLPVAEESQTPSDSQTNTPDDSASTYAPVCNPPGDVPLAPPTQIPLQPLARNVTPSWRKQADEQPSEALAGETTAAAPIDPQGTWR